MKFHVATDFKRSLTVKENECGVYLSMTYPITVAVHKTQFCFVQIFRNKVTKHDAICMRLNGCSVAVYNETSRS